MSQAARLQQACRDTCRGFDSASSDQIARHGPS
jgi:hypothetical protein